MHPPLSLPEPDADARAQSERLARLIRDEIAACGGQITFRRFMELALYAPDIGYYMNALRKFGADGDFITAPEVSPLFSRCVARQCAQVLAHCVDPTVLEVGAGSGVMAADVLVALESLGALPTQYCILELSANLRERQRETLQQRCRHLVTRVRWLDRFPDVFEGVVLANEVLDAMPVQRVRIAQPESHELYVGVGAHGFDWRIGPISTAALRTRVATLAPRLPDGYETEINLAAEAWIQSVAPLLRRGAVLLIDYGFPAHEFFHPQRNSGTLLCHFRHRVHDDPFVHVGLQDITSHVDFTALAEAAYCAGMRVAGFTTQAHFLLALGLETPEAEDDATRWRFAQQINRLTSPAEMGELFKVIAFTNNLDVALDGFRLVDHRGRL